MKTFVNRHFLSGKDTLKFMLFVASAFILIGLGAVNKYRPIQLLPSQNQILDSKPKQSVLPSIHKPLRDISGFEKV
jgi:hypothetical protein